MGNLLISPQGDEIQVVMQLSFKAFNNKAKYMAVLASLWAAKYVGGSQGHHPFKFSISNLPIERDVRGQEWPDA